MSTTSFVVGDRVRLVNIDRASGLNFRFSNFTGREGEVTAVDPAGWPCICVRFDSGETTSMAYADQFEKVAPAAPATPRLFKKGDKVRVVKMRSNSELMHRASVGDVGEVAADQDDSFVQVKLLTHGAYFYYADQFELVADATSAPEYVRTPDGLVAPVEEVTAGGAKLVAGVYYDPARLVAAEAPKPLPEVPTDADTMLRMVDRFLSRADAEARRLQSVLAALRGPDERGVNKAATTVPVRRAAFPECVKKADADGFCHTTNMSFMAEPLDLGTYGGHFGSHIQSAVEALRAMGREVK